MFSYLHTILLLTKSVFLSTISKSIGVLYDIPHGVANSIFLPYVLAYKRPECFKKIADMVFENALE